MVYFCHNVNKDERDEGTTSGMVIGTFGNPDVFRLNPVRAQRIFMISETAIRNPSNPIQVAMKWMINPNGKTVRIGSTEKYYVFTPKSHVVFAWVDEQDVENLLAVRQKSCNCNNGTYKQAFDYANLIDVNLVNCGNRNCE